MPDKLKKLEKFRFVELRTTFDKIFFDEIDAQESARAPRTEMEIRIPEILIDDNNWKEIIRQVKILALYYFQSKRRAPITTLRKCRGHYVYSVSGKE